MKTFAESKGKKPFDWNKALAKPPAINSKKHFDLNHRALDWVTCACGNQCDAIPRDNEGMPKDEVLLDLGCRFYAAVNQAEWKKAIGILARIEDRSKQILEEIHGT